MVSCLYVSQKHNNSFSTNPAQRGAPTGFTVPVREVRLSAGAGFIVVVTGAIMTMPGLPKSSQVQILFMLDEKRSNTRLILNINFIHYTP